MTVGPNPYVIDTGIWIELYRYYPRDLFPDIWSDLDQLFADGRLWSPEDVYRELKIGWDGLEKQIAQDFPGIFVRADNTFLQEVANIRYAFPELQDAQSTINETDYYVIAFALIHHGIVVCTEHPVKPPKTRKKMPDVCNFYTIRWASRMTEFIRERKKETGS